MACRGTKIPEDGLVVLRQQCEAADFVLGPAADVRCRQVAHIVHVKAEKRAHLGFRQKRFRSAEPLAPQPVKIDALLPIHCHGSVSLQRHIPPPCGSILLAELARRGWFTCHATHSLYISRCFSTTLSRP